MVMLVVDKCGHCLRRRRIGEIGDTADAKRTETQFCHNDINGLKEINVNFGARPHSDWSSGTQGSITEKSGGDRKKNV